MFVSNIEDLIDLICQKSSGNDLDYFDQRDKTYLLSISAQFKKSLSLTTNQADVLMKILKKNRDKLQTLIDNQYLIDNPVFKSPFRSVDRSKTITLAEHNKELWLSIKFPYDKKMRDCITKISQTNRHSFFIDSKSYVYPLSHNIIYRVLTDDKISKFGFDVDPRIMEIFEKIKKIKENPQDYKPMLDFDGELVLRNANRFLEKYFNENKNGNILHDTFLGKTLGLTLGKNLIEKLNYSENNSKFVEILDSIHKNNSTVRNSNLTKKTVIEFIQQVDHWPILILLDEDASIKNHLEKWHTLFNEQGIENQRITVLSRSRSNSEFNSYIKDHGLNNLVDGDTKVIFVKNKIPKILYKIDFYPKVLITMSTFFAHYSTQKLLDTHPCVFMFGDQVLQTGKNIANM